MKQKYKVTVGKYGGSWVSSVECNNPKKEIEEILIENDKPYYIRVLNLETKEYENYYIEYTVRKA